jgi:hypothetical protein
MDRFMPIQPTTFDRAFCGLGLELVTLRNCSWQNYQRFNAALGEVREALASIDGLSNVRLIDAHSFGWLLERLDDDGDQGANARRKDAGRIVGGKSIIEMRFSVENTVKNSYGQIIQRTVKDKELRMTSAELEKLLAFFLAFKAIAARSRASSSISMARTRTKTCCLRSIGSTATATMKWETSKLSASSSIFGRPIATTLSFNGC